MSSGRATGVTRAVLVQHRHVREVGPGTDTISGGQADSIGIGEVATRPVTSVNFAFDTLDFSGGRGRRVALVATGRRNGRI